MKRDGKFCSVPQCNSKGTDVPRPCFHSFPRDVEKNPAIHLRKAQWCAALRIGKPITKHFVVCSKHFTKDDYVPSRNITVITQRLKKTAIPSQNLPVSSLMDDEIITPYKWKSSLSKKMSKIQPKFVKLNEKQKNTVKKHCQNKKSPKSANDGMQSEKCQNEQNYHCIVEEGPLPIISNQFITKNSQTFYKQHSDYYVPQLEISRTGKNVDTLRENCQILQSNYSQTNELEKALRDDIQNSSQMQINHNYPQKNVLEQINNNNIPQHIMEQTDSDTMEKNFLKQADCTDLQNNDVEQTENKNVEPSVSNIQTNNNYRKLKNLSHVETSFPQINHHLVKRNLRVLLKCKIQNNENSFS